MISFSVRLTPVARPQPTPIYPVALQLMCSRVEPCPLSPHLPIPISVLLLPPACSFAPLNPPNSGSRLCVCKRMLPSLSLFPKLPSICPFISLSPLSVSLLLYLFLAFSLVRSAVLFVLEIRRGLPDPPFSCAVINYYLLAIHPWTRYPREGCIGGN